MRNKRKESPHIDCWVLIEKHYDKWRETEIYPKDEYTYQFVLEEAAYIRKYGTKVRVKNKKIINEDYDPNYKNYSYYTSEELFHAFAEDYSAVIGEKQFGLANNIEKRCWFADWTDALAQEGIISRELADSVGWEDRGNPYL